MNVSANVYKIYVQLHAFCMKLLHKDGRMNDDRRYVYVSHYRRKRVRKPRTLPQGLPTVFYLILWKEGRRGNKMSQNEVDQFKMAGMIIRETMFIRDLGVP